MTQKNKLLAWIDARFPLSEIWNRHVAKYYAPKNLNFWYFFGSLSLLVLLNQIVTGIFLTMYFTPTEHQAFYTVHYTIMRSVEFGWLIRFLHTTGASAFFIVIYLHMYRAIMYGSYKKPRELLWIIGMILYVLLVSEAFTGYVLPWGQMSYWAGEVIGELFKAIPFIGIPLAIWMQGDYTFSGFTLHRFYTYHVAVIPMLMVIFVIIHLIALRKVGSNNPDGIEIFENPEKKEKPIDGIFFHPYYTAKDLLGIAVFLFFFAAIIFYMPGVHGYFLEPENFIPANPLATPEHIRPAWYLSPFYAILRAVPNKALGITFMGAAIAILFVMPWLDKSRVKSIRYKGRYSKIALTLFVISFITLGYLGTIPVTLFNIWLTRLFAIIYFLFFLLMPFYTRFEEIKALPKRVTFP